MDEKNLTGTTSELVLYTSYTELDADTKSRVDARLAEIRNLNSRDYTSYGMESQQRVTRYANEMFTSISTASDMEDIDSIMAQVLDVAKPFVVGKSKASFLKRVFIPSETGDTRTLIERLLNVGGKPSEIDRGKFAGKIDVLVGEIEQQIGRIMADNVMYDDYIELLVENVNSLSETLIAFEMYRREIESENTTNGSEHAVSTLANSEMTLQMDRLDRKIQLLRMARQESMQVAVSARMIQNNNDTLSDRMQTILVAGIPMLQNQILLKASMMDTQRGLDICDKVSSSINDTMKQNMEQLSELTARLTESGNAPIDGTSVIEMTNSVLQVADEIKKLNGKARESIRGVEEQLARSDKELEELYRQISLEQSKRNES